MALSELTILSGVFSIIVVVIYTYVGLRIAAKYLELKQKVFLFVGITWIGLASPWWPSSVSFLLALIEGGNGLQDTPEIYFMIGNVMIPLFLLLWMLALTDLIYQDKRKIIIILILIYGVAFEAVFFWLLFTDINAVGVLQGPVDVEYQTFVEIFLISVLVILIITGVLFGRESLRSDNPEIKLKGKLIIASIILFDIGAAMDSGLPLTEITLIIARILLILSAIGFYGGFILPDWMKKLFLKQK